MSQVTRVGQTAEQTSQARTDVPDLQGSFDLELLAPFVSPQFLVESQILPLELRDDRLIVAMAPPGDAGLIEGLAMAVERSVELHWAPAELISEAFKARQPASRNLLQDIVDDLDPASHEEDSDRLKDLASEAPVVRLVNHLIEEAVRLRASDIHIEPFPNELCVRLRVDGVLRDLPPAPARLGRAVVSRIKILANLNISERRLPQDGRVAQAVLGRPLDLRVSTVPTVHGESVVIRLLDHSAGLLPLPTLGLREDDATRLRALMAMPNGMILVTGPTGSGKTTTLYAALNLVDSTERKVLTIEDPVEYHMARINQIQVKPTIGLSFATVLRSLLRQDPDVIMVGEMRDAETADVAVHAALTGHLVLSTLHTNSAVGALVRLLDMGIEPFLLTSTVRAVIGQRLVRTLCRHCRRPHLATPDEQAACQRLGLAADVTALMIHQPVGCPHCSGSGYLGRIGLFETVLLDDRLRSLTQARASADELQQAARQSGMESMAQDGLRKVLEGLTSLEEVHRVTDFQ